MLSIRLMTHGDLQALALIYVRAFHSPQENWCQESAYSLLSDWFHRQPDLAFVAEYDQNLAGAFVIGIRPWWDGNHLIDGELFVDPKYQKHGIARELIRTMLTTAKPKYAPIVWETYTFRGQEFPLDWYKRLGFTEINEWMMIRADIQTLLKNVSGNYEKNA